MMHPETVVMDNTDKDTLRNHSSEQLSTRLRDGLERTVHISGISRKQ